MIINFLFKIFKKFIFSFNFFYRKKNKFNSAVSIIYVLAKESNIDLMILRNECLKKKLPDPFEYIIINNIRLPRCLFINDKKRKIFKNNEKQKSLKIFHEYLQYHLINPELDIKLILISIMFGRFPGKEISKNKFLLKLNFFYKMKKLFKIIWFGRDDLIRFFPKISLKYIANKYTIDKNICKKLIKIAKIKFIRQKLVASGPPLLDKKKLLIKLLHSNSVKKAIENEIKIKKISVNVVKNNSIKIIKEIASDISYRLIKLSDVILSWTWSNIYHGLHINNINCIKKLADERHEIIYLPCHRSHIDYLLLSYIIYHQGLAVPHIVAGVNLNFWPIGMILRRLGAFFIRRTFNSEKLYSTVFREYFKKLFAIGYSIEYFIEGSRSRTGLLLKPKTGILTMTIQAMLCNINRPVALVPVYIGYECIIEEKEYYRELHGIQKKKEGLIQFLKAFKKLHNLGRGYVNFGEPLKLNNLLTQQIPHWYKMITNSELQRPIWLSKVANYVAVTVMIRINNAAATNAINICSSILLSSESYALTKKKLLSQIKFYLALLRNVPYSSYVTIPDLEAKDLLNYALSLDHFNVKKINSHEIIFISHNKSILMAYYKNNIQHLFILPSLIANIINNYSNITLKKLSDIIQIFYPLIKMEFFLRFTIQQLLLFIKDIVNELQRQKILSIKDSLIYPTQIYLYKLHLLSFSISEVLQKYAIIFALLKNKNIFDKKTLLKESKYIAKKLTKINNLYILEFSDKNMFFSLIDLITNAVNNKKMIINEIYLIIKKLIFPAVMTNILAIIKENKRDIYT